MNPYEKTMNRLLATLAALLLIVVPTCAEPPGAMLDQRLESLGDRIMVLARPRDPLGVSIVELGCRPNDPTFDNGPVLSEIFQRMHREQLGRLVAPAGDFYVATPIVVPPEFGGVFAGSGAAPYALADGQYTRSPKAVTRFIWNGEPGGSVFVIHALQFTLSDFTVQGRALGKWDDPPNGTIGFDVQWITTIASNAHHIMYRNVSVLACDVGWRTGPAGWPGNQGGHADEQSLIDCNAHQCRIAFQTGLDQSVRHHLLNFTVNGSGDYVLDAPRGGRIKATNLYFPERWKALLRLGTQTHNNNYFDLDFQADGSAKDVVLVEETNQNSPAIVYLRGYIPGGATVAKEPIVQKCPQSRFNVNVESGKASNRIVIVSK